MGRHLQRRLRQRRYGTRRLTVDVHTGPSGTRPRPYAVAYRLLGSDAEAGAALREAERGAGPGAPAPAPAAGPADPSVPADPAGPARPGADPVLTALVRVCLARLREREAARSGPEPGSLGAGPGEEAVLDALPPAERVAYVLHDDFGVPFDEIAAAMELAPGAARQLAARARRRVAEADEMPQADPA